MRAFQAMRLDLLDRLCEVLDSIGALESGAGSSMLLSNHERLDVLARVQAIVPAHPSDAGTLDALRRDLSMIIARLERHPPIQG